MGTLAVGTKTLKRVPQWNHIGSTVSCRAVRETKLGQTRIDVLKIRTSVDYRIVCGASKILEKIMRRPRPASLQRETSTSGSLVPPVPFSGWLDPPTLSTSSTQSTSSSTGGKLVDMFTKLIFQLIFWPLTLGMMLAGPAYRLLLQFGCSSSPLSFRDPPRWLVRLASKPFRWVNPPVTLGIESLERYLRAHAKRRVEHGEGQEQVEGRKNPPRPILLVGNLTLLGLDCLPLLNEVSEETPWVTVCMKINRTISYCLRCCTSSRYSNFLMSVPYVCSCEPNED